MRILLVTPSYFPIVGGSEVLTRVLSTHLNGRGIHCDIMTFNMAKKWNPSWGGEIEREGSATVFKEPALNPLPNLPNPLINFFGICVLPNPTFLRKFKEYDIIHFVGEDCLSFPIFSFFVRKPKLLQCVGIFRRGGFCRYYNEERAFVGKTFKKIFPRVADFFLIGNSEERELLQGLAVPRDKIKILPLGVDTGIFKPGSSKKERNTLLFVGRIDPIKGLHVLLDALQYLATPTTLVIIGPPWDLKYANEMEEKSNEINKGGFHTVTWMGEMNSTEIVPWYQKASILVCPYLYESHSNVVREALACGTPIVSTGTHLVEDCPDGIQLSNRNPKDLANVLDTLLTDQEMLATFGRDGRRVIEEFFSWDVIINNLIRLYKEILIFSKN